MARAGNENDAQIIFLDHAIEVDVDEVEPRRGAPMSEKPRLHVLAFQRFFQERIVIEINLAD